ncbi:RIP metalloprotease RseP [Desulfatibacillum aliphaticivorans]|uniref:RIP metalloprotease RseP n=1 Tax=Desulfatibacillum aliphaticivorans TaxID=218208 RepID=UPI0003FFF031|nr:RIP metalloprotease RseP [Desulfatibacillum aliphaticivorans]
MWYYATVIPLLGALIFFHELGHFLAARLLGVGVETFSLGFGPRLFGKKSGMTDYRVSAVPLGGYVKMVGEDPDSDEEPEDTSISFSHKPVWKRITIVAAGPVFNFLLAVVIFFTIGFFSGVDHTTNILDRVVEDSPAAQAGMLEGDEVLSVNGIAIENFRQVSAEINKNSGEPVNIVVGRNGEELSFTVIPKETEGKNAFGEDVKAYKVGISNRVDFVPYEPINSAVYAVEQTWFFVKFTFQALFKFVDRSIPLDNLGGVILITQVSGVAAEAGLTSFLFIMALLSVNLGIINLFPVPILDGGHILFFAIEGIMRKPLSLRVRELAMQVGLAALIFLMIMVFYFDIARTVAGKAPGVTG